MASPGTGLPSIPPPRRPTDAGRSAVAVAIIALQGAVIGGSMTAMLAILSFGIPWLFVPISIAILLRIAHIERTRGDPAMAAGLLACAVIVAVGAVGGLVWSLL